MRMTTIKKGKSDMKPEKGQKVGCYYKGFLDGPDGKCFDQLQPKARGSQPLSFKGTVDTKNFLFLSPEVFVNVISRVRSGFLRFPCFWFSTLPGFREYFI